MLAFNYNDFIIYVLGLVVVVFLCPWYAFKICLVTVNN